MALGEALASRLGAFFLPIWPSAPWNAAGASPFSFALLSCSMKGFFCISGGFTRSLVSTALLPESSSVNSSPEASAGDRRHDQEPGEEEDQEEDVERGPVQPLAERDRDLLRDGWKQRSTTTPPTSTSAMSSGSRAMA